MDTPSIGSRDGIGFNENNYTASDAIENPFSTPPARSGSGSRVGSVHSSTEISNDSSEPSKAPRQRKFKSARLQGSYDKPWTLKKDPRMVWDRIFFWGLAFVGLAVGAYLIYDGWNSVDNPSYCLIFEDGFSDGIDENNWNYEIQVGGFGTGSFDWTTDDQENSYTDPEGLHIVPTITTNATNITLAQIMNGYTLNLTSQGVCTSTSPSDCVSVSNSTTGTIINPVRSARLNTKGKHNITYGKVEVVAKLPKGSWLWPAIWMMPEADVYGAWPASGEIDIVESKGNNGNSYAGGRNVVSGTLHWAPSSTLDAFWRSTGVRYMQRTDYSDSFHTFAVEWNENYIFTWTDTRIMQSLYFPFGQKYGNMYTRGHFAGTVVNGSTPFDPWSETGRYNTPFDEAFYVTLNVAVGATNGYFKDSYGDKPWIDKSSTAAEQFLNAQPAWEATWGEGDTRGMTVQSVKMFIPGVCGT